MKAKEAYMSGRVALTGANLLRMSLVIASLAASVILLGATITPAQAAFPGKNGKIAFTHSSDIYTVNPDGTNLTNLTADTSTSVSEGGPAWSPDGTKIAFSSNLNSKSALESNDLYVMDADGSNPKRLTNNNYRFQYVGSWSPDGAKMVLSCYPSGWEVCTMDADGSNHIRLTPGEDTEGPSWSPDGTKILFRGPSGAIHTMNSDGSNRTLLIANGDQADWSPDSTKIVYRRYPPGQSHSDIFVANADGSNPVNLTASISNSSYELMPAWSPDGTKIAFMSNLREGYEIYVIDTNGQNLKRLTHSPGMNSAPDWQPLPKSMKSTPEKQQEQRQQKQQPQHSFIGRSEPIHPPDTGGQSLLLVVSALLFSVGSLMSAMVKRRM